MHHLIYACSDESIGVNIESNHIILSLDTMANMGLILQELLTNSLKYALNNGGHICIKILHIQAEKYQLSYNDSGQNLESNSKEKSLGIRLIELKVQQLGGKISLHREDGFHYLIDFYNDRA